MKIACYCQHVLGIGHFHRSLAICRELATHHDVRLIVGGPPVDDGAVTVPLFQLPGLQMDREFNNLAPCDPGESLDEVKNRRRDLLLRFFSEFRPDIFLVELYPFGRKAFRFELDPVLVAIRDGQFGRCRAYVSVRDILVERVDDRDRFEERAVTTLNRFFHGLLIHSDPACITLDETFSRFQDIAIPSQYTGFITPDSLGCPRHEMRDNLQLSPADKLIVVSIGGGNVGGELLTASLEAFRRLGNPQVTMQIFTGPYCPEQTVAALAHSQVQGVNIDRFTPRFGDWLQGADLSISMAGYNTCMNLAQAGIPSLIYPFAQNREQTMRASRFAGQLPFFLLNQADLTPEKLSLKMAEMLKRSRVAPTINLDGARSTRRQLEHWYNEA